LNNYHIILHKSALYCYNFHKSICQTEIQIITKIQIDTITSAVCWFSKKVGSEFKDVFVFVIAVFSRMRDTFARRFSSTCMLGFCIVQPAAR